MRCDLSRKNLLLLVVIGFVALPGNLHAFFGAKFEPPDGKTYHGAQAEVRPESFELYDIDWAGIRDYSLACGHHPKLIMHYISFDERAFRLLMPTIRRIAEKGYNYLAQIGLDFYVYGDPPDILNPIDITQKIAEGEYDLKIRKLARLFKNMTIPSFLRPGYEFGGTGQGSSASKTYWVNAWRRIYTIFRQEKARNVAFVWNTLNALDFIDYYPGNDYVDWWAINVFSNYADQDPFVNGFIQEAASHRKPVMIAESTPRYIGSVGGEQAWEIWYEPYFRLIGQYPHVKAFCYINASWKNYPDPSFAFDCRIQSNPFVCAKYKEMLSDPRFIHAKEERKPFNGDSLW